MSVVCNCLHQVGLQLCLEQRYSETQLLVGNVSAQAVATLAASTAGSCLLAVVLNIEARGPICCSLTISRDRQLNRSRTTVAAVEM